MKINKNQFDELDKKFFSEFELLMDVFVTSMSKLEALLTDQFLEIQKVLEDKVKGKKSWNVSKKNCLIAIHKPFVQKITKVQEIISPFYQISFEQKVFKGLDDKPDNFFWCGMGFYFDEAKPKTYYYISKGGCNKYDGANMPLDFYESLKIGGLEQTIEHPDNGEKDELIEIYGYDFSNEKLNLSFDIFINQIVNPYLENLKW